MTKRKAAVSAARTDAARTRRKDDIGFPLPKDLVFDHSCLPSMFDQLVAEVRRKQPDADAVQSLLFLLAANLEQVRISAENGDTSATHILADFLGRVQEEALQGHLPAELLSTLMHRIVSANVDVGNGLRSVLEDTMAAASEEARSPPPDLAGLFHEIAEDLDFDPFAIHAQFANGMETMHADKTSTLVLASFDTQEQAVRESAIGFVLSRRPDTREQAIALVEEIAGTADASYFTGTMLRRLETMLPWLDDGPRERLAAAIAKIRADGLEATPQPVVKPSQFLCSGVDGVGAMTFIAIAQTEDGAALGSVLVKKGFGVREAWSIHEGSVSRLKRIVREMTSDIDMTPVSAETLGLLLADQLAINASLGTPPPFGFIEFLEIAGQASIPAMPLPFEQALGSLLSEIEPKYLAPDSVSRLIADAKWPLSHPVVASWHQPDVGKLVGTGKQNRARMRKVLLGGPLEKGRREWAWRSLVMALVLRQKKGTDWKSFAILAREIAGGRSLEQIGLMEAVAEMSILSAASEAAERAYTAH